MFFIFRKSNTKNIFEITKIKKNFIKNLGVVAAFLLLAAVHIDNSVESYLK